MQPPEEVEGGDVRQSSQGQVRSLKLGDGQSRVGGQASRGSKTWQVPMEKPYQSLRQL